MTLVSIDVPAARGAAAALITLAGHGDTEKGAVEMAAARAEADTPSLGVVGGLTDQLRAQADGLTARVDLAVIVNGGDEGALNKGPVNYQVPSDTTAGVKTELGQQIASYGAAISGSQDDLAKANRLKAMMAHWLDDGAVMGAMYDKLGPGGTLDLIAAVGQTGNLAEDGALPVAESLRHGLETASRVWPESKAQKWGVDLASYAAAPGFDRSGAYKGIGQALALSFVTNGNGLDERTLFGVADRIDQIERSGNMQPGFWRNRGAMERSSLRRSFGEDRADGAYDPMTSVFRQLADHPATALEFFNNPDRQKYWIAERAWQHDDFRALAQVLDAASTDLSLIDPPLGPDGKPRPQALAAAGLASATIHYLPMNGGFGYKEEGGFFGLGKSHHVYGQGAASNLAHIVATYMPSVDAGLDVNPQSQPPNVLQNTLQDNQGHYLALAPQFNRADLGALLQVAGSSDAGLDVLRTGVSTYRDQQVTQAVQSGTNLQDTITGLGKVEGFFAYNVGASKIFDADQQDARRKAWVDLGSAAVSAVPVPGGAALGFVVSQGVSAGTDAVTAAVASAGGQARLEQNQVADRSLSGFEVATVQLLDDLGALPYQQPGGSDLPANPGTTNGRILTAAEIAKLPAAQRAAAIDAQSYLAVQEDGLKGLGVNPDVLKGIYKDQFSEYYTSK